MFIFPISDFGSTLLGQMRFFGELPSPSHSISGGRGSANSLGLANSSSPSSSSNSKINKAQDQVDELKGIMVENIDQITARGERLELLINRTNDLQVNHLP